MTGNVTRAFPMLVVLALAAACGEPSPGSGSGSGGGSSDGLDRLRIEVRAHAKAEPKTATLTCGMAPGDATGFLEDAESACDAMRKSEQLLMHGPPNNIACIEIYGGPQEARITGTIDGQRVDLEVTRRDGCAIAVWDELQPLLGTPVN
jgi:hypothetical protein